MSMYVVDEEDENRLMKALPVFAVVLILIGGVEGNEEILAVMVMLLLGYVLLMPSLSDYRFTRSKRIKKKKRDGDIR